MSQHNVRRWKPHLCDCMISYLLIISVYGWGFMFLPGCNKNDTGFGKRANVHGSVTLDDKPLDRARIVFKSKEERGTVIAVGTITGGEFNIPAANGPLLGSATIEIFSDDLEMEEYEAAQKVAKQKKVSPQVHQIPARYNTATELSADVVQDESKNFYTFKLTSK